MAATGEIFGVLFPAITVGQLVFRVRVRDVLLDWNLFKRAYNQLCHGHPTAANDATSHLRLPGAQGGAPEAEGGAPWGLPDSLLQIHDKVARIVVRWAPTSTGARVLVLLVALGSAGLIVLLVGGGEDNGDNLVHQPRPLPPLDRLGLPLLLPRAELQPPLAIIRRRVVPQPRLTTIIHRGAGLGLSMWEQACAVAPPVWRPPQERIMGLQIALV